jgi:hypothetical protein
MFFWAVIPKVVFSNLTPIVHWQENGQFSDSSHLESNVEQTLDTYTICVRFWLRYLRSGYSGILVYGTDSSVDGMWICKLDTIIQRDAN